MAQFIPGWIRQLTTRPAGTRLGDLTNLVGKEGTGKTWIRKQLNIRIQSAAADIVTRLITADIILSQRGNSTEEIVLEILHRAFDGEAVPQAKPQPPSHASPARRRR